jgi:AcrR family transcriptional regulator
LTPQRRKKSSVSAETLATPSDADPRRARLPAEERRAQILAEAAALFAEAGFSGTTRELAKRLGITQAALYRHFPSKEALIDALFEGAARKWRAEDWGPALADPSVPLCERLSGLYAAYLGRISKIGDCSCAPGSTAWRSRHAAGPC